MQMFIKPHRPLPMAGDLMSLIILLPLLVIYWCPTSWIIWDMCTGNYQPFGWVVLVWGCLATWGLMYYILLVIRGCAYRRMESEDEVNSVIAGHMHVWNDISINQYGIVVEQQCRCGLCRHHLMEDLNGVPMGGEPKWRLGKHPYCPEGEFNNGKG